MGKGMMGRGAEGSGSATTPARHFAEPEALRMAAEFHTTFQCPVLQKPVIPDADRCKLRVNLIAEELRELADAIQQKDLVEVADALCDIQYVLAGAVHEFGLGDKFSALMDEVHRSNMTKACATAEEAQATVEHYRQKDGTLAHFKEVNGKFMVYRNEDNKTLKSIRYSPVDLRTVLGE